MYRKLFETLRELARLRAKYEKPESDEDRERRHAAYLYEAIMSGDPEPLATGALVANPADAIPKSWRQMCSCGAGTIEREAIAGRMVTVCRACNEIASLRELSRLEKAQRRAIEAAQAYDQHGGLARLRYVAECVAELVEEQDRTPR